MNVGEVNRMCFDPRVACDFGLFVDHHRRAVYRVDLREVPTFCGHFLEDARLTYARVSEYGRITAHDVAVLRSVTTSSFFTLTLFMSFGISEKTKKYEIEHPAAYMSASELVDASGHFVHVWYTRSMPSGPWTATVLDPNYSPVPKPYNNEMSQAIESVLRRYHEELFREIEVTVSTVRHAAALNVNVCTQAGICYTGLCLTLLLLPLSHVKFKSGDEAMNFALRAADALVNSGKALGFIRGVHRNEYRKYVDGLFKNAGKEHPLQVVIDRAGSLLTPRATLSLMFPGWVSEPFRRSRRRDERSRTPQHLRTRLKGFIPRL